VGAPLCVPSDALQETARGHRPVAEPVIAESLREVLVE